LLDYYLTARIKITQSQKMFYLWQKDKRRLCFITQASIKVKKPLVAKLLIHFLTKPLAHIVIAHFKSSISSINYQNSGVSVG
jgi:hypothetical protein